MVRLLSFIVSLIGILIASIPHNLLPLRMLRGAYGAQILPICSWEYHPELYLGLAISLIGILLILMPSLPARKILSGSALFFSIMVIYQGFSMMPVSYYLRKDPIIVWAHTTSINGHLYIKISIIIMGLISVILSFLNAVLKERVKRPSIIHSYTISLRNIRRRAFRTIAIISGTATVIAAIFGGTILSRSIEEGLELGAQRLGADMIVVPKGQEVQTRNVLISGEPVSFYMDGSIAERIASLNGIKRLTTQIYVKPLRHQVCCEVQNILIIGYDPATDFTVAPWIQYKLNRNQSAYDMIVGDRVLFYPGQTVSFYGKDYTISGTLDRTGLGFFDYSAFVTKEAVYEMIKISKTKAKEPLKIKRGDISSILINLDTFVDVDEVVDSIKKLAPEATPIIVREATMKVKRQILETLNTSGWIVALLWIMVVFMSSSLYSMSVNERKREIGLLRAIGADRGYIFRMVMYESLITSITGGIFGIMTGGAAIVLFRNSIMTYLNIRYIWIQLEGIIYLIIISTLIATITGIISALYPAIRSSRLEPYNAIRTGE